MDLFTIADWGFCLLILYGLVRIFMSAPTKTPEQRKREQEQAQYENDHYMVWVAREDARDYDRGC